MTQKEANELIIKINGEKYLTIIDFAFVVNRSVSTIRQLLSSGNRIRAIKCEHLAGKPFIPFSEVTEFPFTVSGRDFSIAFHYTFNAEGTMGLVAIKKET